MASVVYNAFKKRVSDGTIDLDTNTIKIALLMTNTTADTDNDAKVFVADLTTLDECDASGYARVTLANKAVNTDDANDRAEFDADDAAFSGLGGNATRNFQGVLVFKFVTNDADSPLICFVDFASDVAKEATQVNIPWNAEGILQLA